MSTVKWHATVPALSPRSPFAAPRAQIWPRWRKALSLVMAVARERHALAALDDRLLADIGVSRRMAVRESARDILDVPLHRSPAD